MVISKQESRQCGLVTVLYYLYQHLFCYPGFLHTKIQMTLFATNSQQAKLFAIVSGKSKKRFVKMLIADKEQRRMKINVATDTLLQWSKFNQSQ